MSSNGSGKLNTSKSSSARRTATGSSTKNGKEELHKRSTNGEEGEGIQRGVKTKKRYREGLMREGEKGSSEE